MRPTRKQLESVIGRTLRDANDQRVGTIGDIYLDEATGFPEWVRVNISLRNNDSRFMPTMHMPIIAGDADSVSCPYDCEMVHSAPELDVDEPLTVENEKRLYNHYGLTYSTERSESGLPVDAQGTD